MPASSKTDAVIASYAVSMGHFSPRSLASVMSRTVMRRLLLPPYSALLLLSGVFWAAESCVIATAPSVVSRRPHGVPGSPPWWHRVPRNG